MKRWIAVVLIAAAALCAAGCVSAARRTPEGTTLALFYAADPKETPGGDILAAAQVPWSEQAERPAPPDIGRCPYCGLIPRRAQQTRSTDRCTQSS